MRTVALYLLDLLFWAAAVTAVYIPVRLLILRRRKKVSGAAGLRDLTRQSHETALLLFFISVGAVLAMTLTSGEIPGRIEFSKDLSSPNISLEPFRIFRVIAGKEGADRFSYAAVNLAGNIAVFIPVGFFFGAAFGKGVFPSLAFGAGLSLFIEFFQLLTPRHSDIDDLILNSLGALIGAWLLLPFGKLFRGAPEEKKKETSGQGIRERKQKTK